jgi:DNA repair photolyase
MSEETRQHERSVRTAIRKSNLSGSFVVGKYRTSPYMACQHGCAYCDGRAERYFVEGDFSRDIVVRSNVPQLLSNEMPKLREKGFLTIASGITDAYQPLEAELGLTARCAEVLTQFTTPVTIMTKSSLAVRDVDLWARLNEKAGVLFLVSLTFADDKARSVFEPGASPVAERIEALRRYKEAGCHTGVLAMPLLPGISDTEENIDTLFSTLLGVGVDFIMPGGLTLRPGRQKDFYLARIRQAYPSLTDTYLDLFRENRESGAPIKEYSRRLAAKCWNANKKHEIPFLVPHYVYRNRLHIYDEMNVLMHHMVELYEARRIDTKPLKSGLELYMTWLTDKKKEYNRRRSMSYRKLDWELRELFTSGEIAEVVGNDKLADFMKEVALDRKVFDYVSLQLGAA